jgi:hypothetical protein
MMMMLLYRRMMIEGYLMRYHKTILWWDLTFFCFYLDGLDRLSFILSC